MPACPGRVDRQPHAHRPSTARCTAVVRTRRVLDRVGQRLLEDAVDRKTGGGRQASRCPRRGERQRRRRRPGTARSASADPPRPAAAPSAPRITVLVQHPDGPAHFIQALPAETFGLSQRPRGVVEAVLDSQARTRDVQKGDGQGVRDHVVQLAGDAVALLSPGPFGKPGLRLAELRGAVALVPTSRPAATAKDGCPPSRRPSLDRRESTPLDREQDAPCQPSTPATPSRAPASAHQTPTRQTVNQPTWSSSPLPSTATPAVATAAVRAGTAAASVPRRATAAAPWRTAARRAAAAGMGRSGSNPTPIRRREHRQRRPARPARPTNSAGCDAPGCPLMLWMVRRRPARPPGLAARTGAARAGASQRRPAGCDDQWRPPPSRDRHRANRWPTRGPATARGRRW